MRTATFPTAAVLLLLAAPTAAQSVPQDIRDIERNLRRLNEDLNSRLKGLEQRIGDLASSMQKLARQMETAQLYGPPGAIDAASKAGGKRPPRAPVAVRVVEEDWGRFGVRDLEMVFRSAAEELLGHVPKADLGTVVVRRKGSGPIPAGGAETEHVITLEPKDEDWPALVHEFTRQLAGLLTEGEEGRFRRNQWFVGAAGDAAGVFVVRRLATAWKDEPPQPFWRRYIPTLREHADQYVKKHDQVAADALAKWYQQNRRALREGKAEPEKIAAVACFLLRRFESDPAHWEAVWYLNLGKEDEGDSLAGFLNHWYEHVPKRHKEFVKAVADLFGGD